MRVRARESLPVAPLALVMFIKRDSKVRVQSAQARVTLQYFRHERNRVPQLKGPLTKKVIRPELILDRLLSEIKSHIPAAK